MYDNEWIERPASNEFAVSDERTCSEDVAGQRFCLENSISRHPEVGRSKKSCALATSIGRCVAAESINIRFRIRFNVKLSLQDEQSSYVFPKYGPVAIGIYMEKTDAGFDSYIMEANYETEYSMVSLLLASLRCLILFLAVYSFISTWPQHLCEKFRLREICSV